jgi:hypothetical protein
VAISPLRRPRASSSRHEIGEAAQEHRFQAIRSASVTGVDHVLAILPQNLAGAVLAAELVQEWSTAADLR